ncbi:hypothetical protein GLOIN_2v1768492 [Rhizophagus irregularis DAOM 181602=DAOM 197198]|uniref:Uncharacterized protein n=2 Tax=Rhizophagus irregularis TaxID=588596 RepID=A0A015KH91_RHIIW|nr:hypothetical protein GLOIN_2v1768492 [Rhizophagus irregularis DAOM 181602=DAOM 197198]EXX59001.1 hypothetical protein RirG_192710 [Rhizophagus irregularis DAOM 197198w]POG76800.1 hypothetical protein GLOIN_2v1768492 [Rhizophagus irregularis DAOM 181602=DAOM 197198]GBC23060.1 hypothetical protein GLOIN_2v1768492 [Rhizophagus irregularis DAOM 181602=DAOM 197198]|eukprot:XP_025183666.1 hypothetical protein GLOIN_2v1768492 [Rhizophagus irregularis DAOM 181602=DAOM 197198]
MDDSKEFFTYTNIHAISIDYNETTSKTQTINLFVLKYTIMNNHELAAIAVSHKKISNHINYNAKKLLFFFFNNNERKKEIITLALVVFLHHILGDISVVKD